MPLSKRIAMVLLGAFAGFAACVATSYLSSGEPRLGLAIAIALTSPAVLAHQYLIAPPRQ